MPVVAMYRLADTTYQAVQHWWQNDLQRLLQNGAESVFSPRARSVAMLPLGAGAIMAVEFDSPAAALTDDPYLQRFWRDHGVGQLQAQSQSMFTAYGLDPSAMMVWRRAPQTAAI